MMPGYKLEKLVLIDRTKEIYRWMRDDSQFKGCSCDAVLAAASRLAAAMHQVGDTRRGGE